eukprot:2269216-Amphidinium_carterae.1
MECQRGTGCLPAQDGTPPWDYLSNGTSSAPSQADGDEPLEPHSVNKNDHLCQAPADAPLREPDWMLTKFRATCSAPLDDDERHRLGCVGFPSEALSGPTVTPLHHIGLAQLYGLESLDTEKIAAVLLSINGDIKQNLSEVTQSLLVNRVDLQEVYWLAARHHLAGTSSMLVHTSWAYSDMDAGKFPPGEVVVNVSMFASEAGNFLPELGRQTLCHPPQFGVALMLVRLFPASIWHPHTLPPGGGWIHWTCDVTIVTA